MPVKNCVYCAKPLPKTLRADARYCPGSKCRVYAHRRRVLLGQKLAKRKPVPLQLFRFGIQGDLTRQLLMESELRGRMYGSWRPRFVRKEEQVVRLTDVIKLPSDATHLGIHMIPRELGGGAVIITAKSLD